MCIFYSPNFPYLPKSHFSHFPIPSFLGSGWSETFPGVEPHLLTLLVQFWIPGHRELGYWSVQMTKRQKYKKTKTQKDKDMKQQDKEIKR